MRAATCAGRVTKIDVVLLTIGAQTTGRQDRLSGALTSAGASVGAHHLPDPDPAVAHHADLDRVLDQLAGRRLVIAASAAGVAGVLRRMMRRGELAHIETAVLPSQPVAFLARHGIVDDPIRAAEIAVHGVCRTVGVLKDDSGEVVVDHAELRPWRGGRLWVRAYVEDEQLCDGDIGALRVARSPAGGLEATVTTTARFGLGHFRTSTRRSISGRALQLACADAAITSDGAARARPRRKRIWWDEPDQWRLASAR